jgi:hypothetical protein
MERRLLNLETGAGLTNTSVRGGSTQWISSDDGRPLAIFGVFGDGVSLFEGFVQYDGDGEAAFMTRSDKPGIIHPADGHLGMIRISGFDDVTSATYVTVMSVTHPLVAYEGLRIVIPVLTGAATVGELRMTEQFSGAVTNSITVAANTFGYVRFEWKHGVEINSTARFDLEVKRNSGASFVRIFDSYDQQQVSSAINPNIATNGNPVLDVP